jgi:diguanylate cyclase (GGDEF)-like protein/PAS domain S-box-containing protein
LLIEDDPNDYELLVRKLRTEGFAVDALRVDTLPGVRHALQSQKWDLVLSDHSMPGFRSADVLAVMHTFDLPTPLIIVSGAIGEDEVVDALHLGAAGYVEKSRLSRLVPAIERALNDVRLREEHAQARERLEMVQAAVDAAFDLICIVEAPPDGGPPKIIYANAAAESMTGYTPAGLAAIGFEGLCRPGDATGSVRLLEAVQRREATVVEVTNRDAAGNPLWVEIAIRPIAGSSRLILASRDVTARKTIERKLAFLALHDPLTRLSNRAMLFEHLDLELAATRRSGLRVGVLLVDLDNFKQVNDSAGHAFGDAVLIEISRRLCCCVRENDTVTRYGGDEFVVVLGGLAGLEPAADVARRVVRMVAEPIEFRGDRQTITASIGISVSPHDGDSAEELLRNADAAMYRVKQTGRNAFLFHE